MLLEAVVGILGFLAGVVAISRPTKQLHPAIKYTPIILCAMGAFNLWDHFSKSIPAVADAKVAVLQVQPQQMYVNIEPQFARKCKLRAVDAYLVDANKVETRVPTNFVDPKNYSIPRVPSGWQPDSVLEIHANPRQYESFYFVEYDRCAFGVPVRSEFGHTLIPQRFNAGLPTGEAPSA